MISAWCGLGEFPCMSLACCDDRRGATGRRQGGPFRTLRAPGFPVELLASPLAGMKGAAGYHTSVLVDDEEYFFGPSGITASPRVVSHPGGEGERSHVGLSRHCGAELLAALEAHFQPGSYDLLTKNCNSFSECALYFLCGSRLDWKYKVLDRLGKMSEDHTGFVQRLSSGEYVPNRLAAGFSLELVIADIDAERDTCDGDEHSELGDLDDYPDEFIIHRGD